MAPIIEKLPIPPLIIGEGPHWDIASQSLFMVDVVGALIVRYDYKENKSYVAKLDIPWVSFIIPVTGREDQYIIGSELKLYLIKWDGVSENIESSEVLHKITTEPEQNKINDAKCDSEGRLWFGTLRPTHVPSSEPSCKIYSFSKEEGCREHAGNIRVSNGLTFDLEDKHMYYIDTSSCSVDIFDYNVNGTIENRRKFFDFKKNKLWSYPDGMTVDKDGNIWVACFDGSQVINISKSGNLIQKIKLETPQITSVAWGGEELEELFVTSGNIIVEGDGTFSKSEHGDPNAGCVFRVSGLETTGVPMNQFKLS